MTGIHQGVSGGNASASNTAVISALPSSRVVKAGRLRSFRMAASAMSAVMLASRILNRIPQPNIQSAQMMPGTSASNTRSIMADTLFATGKCGEL